MLTFKNRLKLLLLSVVFLLVLGSLANFLPAEIYRLATEEKLAIENRKKISRYVIEMDCESFDPYDKNFSKIVGRAFFFDGKNTRNDTRVKRDVQIRGEDDIYNRIQVWTKDKLIDFTQGAEEDGNRSGVAIRPIETARNENAIPRDPRSIGMSPNGFMLHESIEKKLGCTERENPKSSDEIIRGVSCKRFTYTHPRYGTVNNYWIAPSLGYSVIRIESFHDGVPRAFPQEPNDPMTNRTELEVSEYKSTGLWFPTSMKFVRTNEKTKDIELRENYTIRAISLNDTIDSDLFTLKGLDIPVGNYVMLLPDSAGDNFFWDGNEIQSEHGSVINRPSDTKRYTLFRTALIVVGLGLIAAACFSRYIQLHSNQRK